MSDHLLILDGRHLLYRTADVFRDLSYEDESGEHHSIGAIYGFLSVMLSVHRRWGGVVVVAWEGSGNFRYEIYPEYKAKKEAPSADQKAMYESMDKQEAELKTILKHLGVRQYEGRGCEADDVMGTIAAKMAEKGRRTIIYTGDSDLRQMCDEYIKVVAPGRRGKDTSYDEEMVKAKHGVAPADLALMKALAGDGSDNIPGISGVGPKKAIALIERYGTLANILKAAKEDHEAWPIPERFRAPIVEKAAELKLYFRLTTILRDARMRHIEPERSKIRVLKKFKKYRFRSLLAPLEMRQLLALRGVAEG